MHSPKMTRSLQNLSDKFGGSLPSVNRIPHKMQLQDKIHSVHLRVSTISISEMLICLQVLFRTYFMCYMRIPPISPPTYCQCTNVRIIVVQLTFLFIIKGVAMWGGCCCALFDIQGVCQEAFKSIGLLLRSSCIPWAKTGGIIELIYDHFYIWLLK